MLAIMDKKGFVYVENFEIINFDIEKAKLFANSQYKGLRKSNSNECEDKKEERTENEDLDLQLLVKALDNVNPADIVADQISQLFNISKRTLLMFKKVHRE
jgi:hypothetical protein